ncbi:sensor kinase CckA [Candidatus Phycosocius bacilliformis]|uniref:histidine kinase n=1 Tax=Candidatus Phycosocius bacilliformis TaxID=1445552 RepID=A0A2P2E8Y0_9PROT|nr:response regulator [Candidatus Phycosocius bacilliformis]GBF57508.1 sensor kinase CckA [Candidatus Phycosocius bacilliformis]
MAGLLTLFSRSESHDWLASMDGPAALFSRSGRYLDANQAYLDIYRPVSIDPLLMSLLDRACAFRASKAVRRGLVLDESVETMRVRVTPIGDRSLVRLTAIDQTPAADTTGAGNAGQNNAPGLAHQTSSSLLTGLARLIAEAPVGIARLDRRDARQAKIEEANPAFIRIAGGGKGAQLADLIALSHVEELERLEVGNQRPIELDMAHAGGQTCEGWLLQDDGEGAGLLLVDVSARREMEHRLAQTSKMQAVGQIAGGVAHELNNFLLVITLNCDALLARHPVGDPSYGELQSIQNTSSRAAELVKMLLAYARKQTFRRDVLDVGAVLTEFAVLMRQVLDERIVFDITHGRDLPNVRADKQQLETVFMNLVTNARDAVLMSGKGKGSVTVRTKRATTQDVRAALKGLSIADIDDCDWAMISVTDTGTGMSPDVATKIFEPFFTTKEQGKGTGIGLATVYGIIKQSDGFIALDSIENVGTTFHVFLPATTADDVSEEAPVPAGPAPEARPMDLAGRGRILLVEDEEGVRNIATRLLTQRGYHVTSAGDGEEALEILENDPNSFDLVLSDVVMPGLDGPSLLKAAKPYLGHARIVFMSGYAEQDFAQTLEDERSISFLPKPFTLAQLAERVKMELAAA